MNLLVILRDFAVADGEDNETTRAEAHLPMFLYSSKKNTIEDHGIGWFWSTRRLLDQENR